MLNNGHPENETVSYHVKDTCIEWGWWWQCPT